MNRDLKKKSIYFNRKNEIPLNVKKSIGTKLSDGRG